MAQTWEHLLFAHWVVDADALRRHLPDGLTLDTFEGRAYLGVVPFVMSWVRPRWLPAVPRLSFFPELNVRTYVTDGEKSGVWFFSLDARSPLAVWTARRWFHLPYFKARMRCRTQGDGVIYASVRTHRGAPAARFEATYRPTGPVALSTPGSLDHWLTERYCLYAQDPDGGLHRGEIHHQPWPLQPAAATLAHNTMAAAHEVARPDEPALLHFARRLRVAVWSPTPVR